MHSLKERLMCFLEALRDSAYNKIINFPVWMFFINFKEILDSLHCTVPSHVLIFLSFSIMIWPDNCKNYFSKIKIPIKLTVAVVKENLPKNISTYVASLYTVFITVTFRPIGQFEGLQICIPPFWIMPEIWSTLQCKYLPPYSSQKKNKIKWCFPDLVVKMSP